MKLLFSVILMLSCTCAFSMTAYEVGPNQKLLIKLTFSDHVVMVASANAGGGDYRINTINMFAIMPSASKMTVLPRAEMKKFLNTKTVHVPITQYGYFQQKKFLV